MKYVTMTRGTLDNSRSIMVSINLKPIRTLKIDSDGSLVPIHFYQSTSCRESKYRSCSAKDYVVRNSSMGTAAT